MIYLMKIAKEDRNRQIEHRYYTDERVERAMERLDQALRSMSHSPSPSYHDEPDDDRYPKPTPSASLSPSASPSPSVSLSPSPSEEIPDEDTNDSWLRAQASHDSMDEWQDNMRRLSRNSAKPTPAQPTCTHCRMPIEKDTRLCPYCGAPQE